LPVEFESPRYRLGEWDVPVVHASAARDATGKLHVGLANLDPTRAAHLSINVAGAKIAAVSGRILTAPRMNAINTFDVPGAVKPAVFDARVREGQIVLTLPPKSVAVLDGGA
jgi:alpha-L-arabinofuranosidase